MTLETDLEQLSEFLYACVAEHRINHEDDPPDEELLEYEDAQFRTCCRVGLYIIHLLTLLNPTVK